MELDDRKLRILQAIIDDYILTAVPVGSRTISRKYEQSLSSATIRNEMSDLEELGYLDSPHTSAGRVPSYKAYRLYVDQMLRQLGGMEVPQEHFMGQLDRRLRQVQDIAQHAAQVLSSATQYTTVVMTHTGGNRPLRIQHIQLVGISPGLALMVIVTDSGTVKETVLHVTQEMGMDDLYQVSRILSAKLAGVPLDALGEALAALAGRGQAYAPVFEQIVDAVREQPVDHNPPQLVVGGRANILNYLEYGDMEKARALLSVLETKEKLMKLLLTESPMEFTIRIGPEIGMPETQDCSVVTATYRIGGDKLSTIGIIGPTRMQYRKVLAMLDRVGKSFASMLEDTE